MYELKADTQVIVPIGPFVDVGDGFTPETGITLGAADEAELLKHGSTSVVSLAAATWAAITSMDGYYALTLTTSHTDTEGMLTVVVQDDSVCLPVKVEFCVLSQAAYDSKYATKAAGFMDVNVRTIGRSDAQETEADNLEAAAAAYSVTRGLAGTALPAAAADGVGGLPISDAGGLDLDALNTAAVRLTAARAQVLDDWINAGRLDAILDNILADTNELQSDDVPGLIAALNDPTAAAVADAVWDEAIADHAGVGSTGEALAAASSAGDPWATALPGAYGAGTAGEIIGDWKNAGRLDAILDTIAADVVNIDGAAMRGTDNAALASALTTHDNKIGTVADLGGGATIAQNFSDMAGATFSTTTDSLEAVRNHIGDGTNLTEAGGTGNHLTAVPWNAAWDTEVQSECTDALNAYDPPTNAEMVARTLVAASYFDPAADTVANVTTVGSVSGAVDSVTGAVGSVTGAVGSVTGNVGGNVVGSVGSLVGHTVQTGDSFARIGVAGAGLTNINLPNQTMDIVGDITGNLSGSVGSVTGAVGSVTGAVGSVTGAVGSVTGNVGGNVVGSVGSLVGHTVQTGDSFARIGATGSGLTSLATVSSIWAHVIENSLTAEQIVRGVGSALMGKASGMGTATGIFRDLADSKARITATTDANGNRSAVTLDLT